jgi:hypothetical protein
VPVKREWTPPPDYKATTSIVKAEDDPEEFSGLRCAHLESFEATDEFVEARSAADHRREEEERCRRLGLFVNRDDDAHAGQSSRSRRRLGDTGQGCSYLAQPKEEPNDGEDDYAAAMYRRLGLGRGSDIGY